MNNEPGDESADDDLYAYPGTVAVLYLDEPSGTLTPEQTAFLLGNDRRLITDLMLSDEAGAEQWTADALDARRGVPDPVLVEASAGKDGLAEACLTEARAWSTSAQAKRAALAFLDARPRPVVPCPVSEEMAVVQELSERSAELRRDCDEVCQVWPDPCATHGPELQRREDALVAAVDEMRRTMSSKLAELNAQLAGQ